jgi:DNA-binding PadR family transcriptional regulator
MDIPEGSLKPHWFQILLALADQDLHGSAIMEEVLERTRGEMKLWPGSLYGALRRLTELGCIGETHAPDGAPTEGGKRRFYKITPIGRLALSREVERLVVFVRAAKDKKVVDDLEIA